jgi:transposase
MAMRVSADEQWRELEPLLNEVRPRAARPIREFRHTIEAIVGRQQNGAKWRAIPAELGPWWRAAQTFIRRARLEAWERLHRLVRERRGTELGMVFLDGTVIRAHQKAAGARKAGPTCAASAEAHALGRSRGGYGTKGHVLADARGRAIAFVITPGRAAELPRAEQLLGFLPGNAGVGGRRPRLLLPRPARGDPRPRRHAGHTDPEERGPGGVSRVDLRQPQPGRTTVVGAQGVAGRRYSLRQDGALLPWRPEPRRHLRLAQTLTGPSTTVAPCA